MIVALVVFMFLLVPQGIYRWTDGSIYEGSWTDNVIDGPGCYLANDGRSFKGQWSDRRDGDFGMAIFFFFWLGRGGKFEDLGLTVFWYAFWQRNHGDVFFFCGAGFHDSWNGPLCLKLWEFDSLTSCFKGCCHQFFTLTQWRMMKLYPRYESWYSFWYPFSEEWPGGRWRSSQKNSTTWWELHGVINSVNSHSRWKRMIHSYVLWRTHLDS